MEDALRRTGAYIKRFLILLFASVIGVGLIGGGSISLLFGAVKSMGYLPDLVIRIGFWELASGWIMPVAGLAGGLLILGGLASLYKAFEQI
jgi:hypothetical protein